jgi:16S rRNA (guanine1207-N2)-methyltransferase
LSTAAELLYAKATQWLEGRKSARILALNAVADPVLRGLAETHALTAQQSFRPDWLQLQRMGIAPVASLEEIAPVIAEQGFDLAMVLPGKQREESLGLLATAMLALHPDGMLLAACANDMGGKSYEKRLAELDGPVEGAAKSHCRLFRTRRSARFDQTRAETWVRAAAPRTVPAHGLIARPGNFSWEKPDSGSELLRRYLENRPLGGSGMDLCCGYGYLAHRILTACPGLTELYLVDADRHALDCAIANTGGARVAVHARWLDAASESLPGGLDWIVLNPPFHRGKAEDIALGQAIAARACQSLKPGGRLAMVANRQLPYERLCGEMLTTCDVAEQSEGFKILDGIR